MVEEVLPKCMGWGQIRPHLLHNGSSGWEVSKLGLNLVSYQDWHYIGKRIYNFQIPPLVVTFRYSLQRLQRLYWVKIWKKSLTDNLKARDASTSKKFQFLHSLSLLAESPSRLTKCIKMLEITILILIKFGPLPHNSSNSAQSRWDKCLSPDRLPLGRERLATRWMTFLNDQPDDWAAKNFWNSSQNRKDATCIVSQAMWQCDSFWVCLAPDIVAHNPVLLPIPR